MYTILLFTHSQDVRKELTLALEAWKVRPLVLSVGENPDPVNSCSAGLAVVELPDEVTAAEKRLMKLTRSLPWLPFLAVSHDPEAMAEIALSNGAEACLRLPLNEEELIREADALLSREGFGVISGIPLHSCLQIIESENTTCTLEVSYKSRRGLLFLRNGNLIDAMTGTLSGEAAALEIMGWPESTLQMRFFNDQRPLQINRPGLELIMEAYRKRSEEEILHSGTEYIEQHQLAMKHFSTADHPIPLSPQDQVIIQLKSDATPLSATFVGMLAEHLFITTNPFQSRDCTAVANEMNLVLIKFIHNGRVWIFKTFLQQQIEGPQGLLLFSWPQVLHCHELRKARRTAIYVPSTFRFDDGQELYGALIDLSLHGSLYQIKRHEDRPLPALTRDTPILLRCLLPGIKEEQVINCRVRNLRTTATHHHIGVEFERVPAYLANIITRYLCTQEESPATRH